MKKNKKKVEQILLDYPFEFQPKINILEVDMKVAEKYIFNYKDGYYIVVTDHTTHIANDNNIEAVIYNEMGERWSTNWPDIHPDDVPYKIYHWIFDMRLKGNDVYEIELKQGIAVGGGAF